MKIWKEWPNVILIILLVVIVVMFAGLFELFFESDATIVAGVIGCIGAIIGGGITLLGVRYSIEHNEKMRTRNELPDKLFRIESVKSLLEKIIEKDLVFEGRDPYNPTNNFVGINRDLQMVKFELIEKFTEDIPETLKKDFVYIDAETYRMYLDFKNKIYLLESRMFSDAEIKLMDFQEKALEKVEDYMEKYDWLLKKVMENSELKDEMSELTKLISKKDREYTFHLSSIYNDLYMQILLKHEQLILELDY